VVYGLTLQAKITEIAARRYCVPECKATAQPRLSRPISDLRWYRHHNTGERFEIYHSFLDRNSPRRGFNIQR